MRYHNVFFRHHFCCSACQFLSVRSTVEGKSWICDGRSPHSGGGATGFKFPGQCLRWVSLSVLCCSNAFYDALVRPQRRCSRAEAHELCVCVDLSRAVFVRTPRQMNLSSSRCISAHTSGPSLPFLIPPRSQLSLLSQSL